MSLRLCHFVVEPLENRRLLSVSLVRPDHIVVLIEEDRTAHAIGDLVEMPYFNQVASSGLVYGDSQSVGHPSRLNYLGLFSGSTQGVTDNFERLPLFDGPNLAKSLNTSGKQFVEYSESLPADGSLDFFATDPNDPDHHPDDYFLAYNASAQFSDYGPGKLNA